MQVHKFNGIDSPRAQAVHSVSRIWIYFAFADKDPPNIKRVRKKKEPDLSQIQTGSAAKWSRSVAKIERIRN